ncbi:MAG: class I SAM-dependent methyltransferase [Chloroflexota bacterium]|nr:class I SAM-dependent methyltransferase [Chloroflexota bacterium]
MTDDRQPPAQRPAGNPRAAGWDQAYSDGWAPWDIGRPQPAFLGLADAGEVVSPVLDSGCGTGEHALMLAERGIEVLGVDLSPTAIERARAKARDRGLAAEFVAGDVLELDRLAHATDSGPRFASVIDSGTFHTFDDADRARYVRCLAAVVREGGALHLLCFSEKVPGNLGPRRISQAELRHAFRDGWSVERIDAAEFEVNGDWPQERPRAWLARIVRVPD